MTDKPRSPYWIQTYSKGQYDFSYNYPEDINIVDIAHSLAQKPHFGGHLKYPFSIAQHSLTMAAAMAIERNEITDQKKYSNEICLQALMHDAHEAYIPDFTIPFATYLKEVVGVDLEPIKQQIDAAISERFGIDLLNQHPDVKMYDKIVIRSEAEDLWDRVIGSWHKDMIDKRLVRHITRDKILPFHVAKSTFIKTFKRLGGEV